MQWANFESRLAPAVLGLAPVSSVEQTLNGISIDQQALLQSNGGPREAIAYLMGGAASGSPTGINHTMKWQHSSDNSNWSDVTDTNELVEAASVSLTATNSVVQLALRLKGCKRYVRPQVALDFTGGSTPAQVVAVLVALGAPRST